MSATMGELQQGLRDWVKSATGLGDAFVIFAGQKGPRPTHNFATIRITGAVTLGAVDEKAVIFDPGADLGEEVEERVRMQTELSLALQFYSRRTVAHGGVKSAMELALNAQGGLGIADVRNALGVAGLSPFDKGTVRSLDGLLDDDWEGRAELALRMYTTANVSSFTGYITTVEMTGPDGEEITSGAPLAHVRIWILDANGDPVLNLDPGWVEYREVMTGLIGAPPAWTEQGNGLYTSPKNLGWCGFADFGPTVPKRFCHVAGGLPGMLDFPVYGPGGAPLAGTSPSWASYVRASTGAAILPQPPFAPIGGGLHRVAMDHDSTGLVILGGAAEPAVIQLDKE